MNQPLVLLVATRNRGKLRELKELLSELPMVLRDLDAFPAIKTIPETGRTFAENAILKAGGYARQTGVFTLADDSGLEVDALEGAPGVLSARHAGAGASDRERVDKLLRELAGFPDAMRRARFISIIAVADPNGEIINISQGICEGRMAQQPRGSHGFGYDPIFIPDEYDETLGELSAETKNRISHRARALAATVRFLRSLTDDRRAG